MKLLNVGQRDFITPYGKWSPMGILEVPDGKEGEYLAYGDEVKVLEDVKEAVQEVGQVSETTRGTKKTKKR
jgi:hypothetical protein